MRVLVEPSDYVVVNRGDAASLYVGLNRLRELWPEATIEVLTDDPQQVGRLAPSIATRPTSGHRRWNQPAMVASMRPTRASTMLRWSPAFLRAEMRMRWPQLSAPSLGRRSLQRSPVRADVAQYVAAVATADVVVVTGMGGIADDFRSYAIGVLGTLAIARHHGVPTAMLSQQIGPVTSRSLERVSRRVLPDVDMIALRESRTGLPLLRQLGVDAGRVRTTGDDTIECVLDMRKDTLGTGIGLNLRMADYTRIGADQVERVGEIVRAASVVLNAPLVGLPISHNGDEDTSAIDCMTRGAAGLSYPLVTDLEGFVALVQRCRVVVCGSYHAAVFALASGIPAVCLTNSPYYDQKFMGLAALFGEGCEVVGIGASLPTLREAIERAWTRAPELKAPLLDAAGRQVEMGRAAYADLAALVARSRKRRAAPRAAARSFRGDVMSRSGRAR